jgi:hypothetical protein
VAHLGEPGAYTERGRRFDSIVKYLMGGDLPFRIEGLKSRYLMNLGLRLDPERETRPARRAVSTLHVRYRIDPGLGLTEEELNATVRRFAPARGARSPAADPVFAEFTARIRVPLMTLHNTSDGWVPFAHQQDYRRKAIASGTGHLLVQRAVRWPGHCNFEGEDREQAFNDLVRWMETGVAGHSSPASSRTATTCWATRHASACAGLPCCTPPTPRGSKTRARLSGQRRRGQILLYERRLNEKGRR